MENEHCRNCGKAMLALIARLRSSPDDRRAYGLTSHAHLCLLAEDSYRSPWFVVITALDENNFIVEYRMPAHIAPWPNANVRGEARSVDEAVRMVLIAIEKSEGWTKKQ